MSKSLFIFLLIAAAVGFYLYKSNRFTQVRVSFDYTPTDVSITAREMDLHDCKLNLTHDYGIDLPVLRLNQRMTVGKDEFKQWNGTALEKMSVLGPEIEFKLRCQEGYIEQKETNRYASSPAVERERRDEQEVDSN